MREFVTALIYGSRANSNRINLPDPRVDKAQPWAGISERFQRLVSRITRPFEISPT